MEKLLRFGASLALLIILTSWPTLGLVAIGFLTMAYVRPDWVERIPHVTAENNIFRHTPWWKFIPLRAASHLALIGIVGFTVGSEIDITVVILGGGLIVAGAIAAMMRTDDVSHIEYSPSIKWLLVGVATIFFGCTWGIGSFRVGLALAGTLLLVEWALYERLLDDIREETERFADQGRGLIAKAREMAQRSDV